MSTALPDPITLSEPIEEALKRAYYYNERGEWRGCEAVEWDRWHSVAKVAAAERESQAAQIAALKTVMVAAAEEIAAHWNAHCDAEGYGPQNLLRRLEEGIPSEYGYTAGAFAALTAERDARTKALLAFRSAGIDLGWGAHPKWFHLIQQCDEALAARTQAHKPAIKGQTPDTPPTD